MSIVSGSQMNFGAKFVPRASPSAPQAEDTGGSAFGEGGREYSGPRSVAPIARGAFSSQDRALSMRHEGENTLSHGAKNIGSWLFKMD
mgnify:CR=1 FL=1|jgi:hypothetical protein